MDVTAAWDDLTPGQQRAVITALVTVTIESAGRCVLRGYFFLRCQARKISETKEPVGAEQVVKHGVVGEGAEHEQVTVGQPAEKAKPHAVGRCLPGAWITSMSRACLRAAARAA
jgi:hypothetical protein